MIKEQFMISFRSIMTLLLISVMLLPFYHIPQFAWSQALVSPNGHQHASNSSSHFIFPSQEQFFFPSVNASRQTDLAILNGTWTVENSRVIAQAIAGLDPHPPKMAFVVDHYIPTTESKPSL